MKKLTRLMTILATVMMCTFFCNSAQAATVFRSGGSNLSSAAAINVGDTVNTSFSDDRSQYYRFSVPYNCYFQFGASTGGHSENACFRILDASGQQAFFSYTSDPYNWGYQTASDDFGLSAGTYYLEVIPNLSTRLVAFSTSVFRYTGSTVKVAGQNNNYLSRALPFTLGNALQSVAYNRFNGIDWDPCHYYRFSVSSTRKVTIKAAIPQSAVENRDMLWIDVYNSAGKYLKFFSLSGKTSQTFTFQLNKGVYYLGISTPDSSVTYTISTASSSTAAPKPKVAKVKSVSAKSPSKGKVKVSWKKTAGQGYEIQFCRSKNFKSSKVYKKTITKSSATSYKRTLTKGKKYYVRVRAFTRSGGKKIYGSWSSITSVKVRKK